MMFGVDNVSCVGLTDKNVDSAGPRVRDSKQQSLLRLPSQESGYWTTTPFDGEEVLLLFSTFKGSSSSRIPTPLIPSAICIGEHLMRNNP